MKEAPLTNKIRLRILKRGGWARKLQQNMNSAGLPDLIAMYRGYGLYLEVKVPGRENTLTKLQSETLAAITAAGGIARMVTSVAQVDALLDKIDKIKDKQISRGEG